MIPARSRVNGRGRRVDSGLLASVAEALAGLPPGGVLEVSDADCSDAPEIGRWSRVTGHAVVGQSDDPDGTTTFRIRKSGGTTFAGDETARPERRLWLYTNLDCNLSCDYCCVRSSPRADRRAIDASTIESLGAEAAGLGFERICVTGGEPFLLPDIAEKVAACARSLPTTVLTNAMLFSGPRRGALEAIPRERVILQVSLDSPTPERHDAHRGAGSWKRAREGIVIARELGFRMKVAATVQGESERLEMDRFLESEGIPREGRVIRPVALRGNAETGVPLARAEIDPELTVTSRGVFWHPVGADDEDFFVCREPLPLARAVRAMESKRAEDREFGASIAGVFRCA